VVEVKFTGDVFLQWGCSQRHVATDRRTCGSYLDLLATSNVTTGLLDARVFYKYTSYVPPGV